MSLTPGHRLGPYEVLAKVGEGGMGEVYRARDTKLNREVALKTLPAAFTADPDRLARFEREALALAALNHPNIAQIYGLEQNAIVMELVEGQTLDEMMRSPGSKDPGLHLGESHLGEALPIARQIALALEAAHDAGIVHRDLKPGNIKVRPDGTVKVLDFGLAKAAGSAGSKDPASTPSRLADSPTLTARATEIGLILGTAAYMSPEQAKGRVVDRRTDVWAFGVVLYEMLTGRRAFSGDDVTEVLAAVIRDTPSFDALPPDTPLPIRRLLRRCLEKDPRKRLRDMGDAGLEIDAAISGDAADDRRLMPVAPIVSSRRPTWLAAATAVGLAALAAAAAWLLKPAPPADRSVARFTVTLPQGHELVTYTNANLAISGDGRRLAYRTAEGIFLRDLASLEPRFLARVPGSGLWFSADGTAVMFGNTSGLARVSTEGGPIQEIAPAAGLLGADWGDDGAIVFAAGGQLVRVPATGGKLETLVDIKSPSELVAWPQSLAGGRLVLYTKTSGGMSTAATLLLSVADRAEHVVLPGVAGARYLETGHLVYGQEDRLFAVPFDISTRKVGAPVTLPEAMHVSPQVGWVQAAFARNGTLAYMPPGSARAPSRLVWVDATGASTAAPTAARVYSDLALSPNGRRAAVHLWDEDNDIWVADLVRGTLTRITYTPTEEETPVWSPDGTELVYATTRPGQPRTLYRRKADGSATAVETKVFGDPDHFHVDDWSPDGKTIVVEVRRSQTVNDLIAVDVATGQHKNLLVTPYSESQARFSRDGNLLAYTSTESSRDEVYVQAYPAMNERQQVSRDGGTEPVWSRDRKRLFYRSPKGIMEVSIKSTSPLEFSAPRLLFEDRFRRTQTFYHTHFDVAPDGRFLFVEDPSFGVDRPREEIHIVLNWFETLKRLAPDK